MTINYPITTSPGHCPTCGNFLRIHNGVNIDLNKNAVVVDGKAIHLEPKVCELLSFLLKRAPQPATIDAILTSLYGSYGEEANAQTIRTYVHKLRESLSGTRLRIITHYGDGYSAVYETT